VVDGGENNDTLWPLHYSVYKMHLDNSIIFNPKCICVTVEKCLVKMTDR